MILPDINVLLHAHNLDSPVHEKAKAWWDGVLAGNEGVGLPWVTILGFIRITTHRGILQNPFEPADACERISEWLSLPHFHIPTPGEEHFELLSNNLSKLGTAGNLTTDAHLATLAMKRGYTLCSTDSDFARFPGLKWENPIQGKTSANKRR